MIAPDREILLMNELIKMIYPDLWYDKKLFMDRFGITIYQMEALHTKVADQLHKMKIGKRKKYRSGKCLIKSIDPVEYKKFTDAGGFSIMGLENNLSNE